MTDLTALKRALRQKIQTVNSHPLTDQEYSLGFEVFQRETGRKSYHQFIIPQLSTILTSAIYGQRKISILEVGPGPETILAWLPLHLKQRIGQYTAFEPNHLFARQLRAQLEHARVLSALESSPGVRQSHFTLTSGSEAPAQFDIILFCHSLYGLNPKDAYIRHAVELLKSERQSRVEVFHRHGDLALEGLVCQRTSAEDTNKVCVSNDETALDNFAAFILGFTPASSEDRNLCRVVCQEEAIKDAQNPSQLIFESPTIMMTFNAHATYLSELINLVPTSQPNHSKSWQATRVTPAAVLRPHTIEDVQRCVQWSVRYKLPLTVQGGGHGANCRRQGIVCVDMSNTKNVVITDDVGVSEPNRLVVVQAGATTGDVIRETMAAGLTVP